MKAGDAFLIPSGTYHNPETRHLFVVCTQINNAGEAVLVCISSWKNKLCDDTCVLVPGEHEFITKKSYASYRHSVIKSDSEIAAGLHSGQIINQPPVNGALRLKLKNGAMKSKQTPRKIKRFISENS